MKYKVTNREEARVAVQPTYGYAMKLARQTGTYKVTSVIGWLLMLAVIAFIVFAAVTNYHMPAGTIGTVLICFGVAALGAGLVFAKPSQTMSDNSVWLSKEEFQQREAAGTVHEVFTRTWR